MRERDIDEELLRLGNPTETACPTNAVLRQFAGPGGAGGFACPNFAGQGTQERTARASTSFMLIKA
jgi:hypothetical protein